MIWVWTIHVVSCNRPLSKDSKFLLYIKHVFLLYSVHTRDSGVKSLLYMVMITVEYWMKLKSHVCWKYHFCDVQFCFMVSGPKVKWKWSQCCHHSTCQGDIMWTLPSETGAAPLMQQVIHWTMDCQVMQSIPTWFCVPMSGEHCSYSFIILSIFFLILFHSDTIPNIDGLVQERRNSIALAMELCLSWTNPFV